MPRSSQRHNREIHGVDSSGRTASDMGETYNNRVDSAGNPVPNPYEPVVIPGDQQNNKPPTISKLPEEGAYTLSGNWAGGTVIKTTVEMRDGDGDQDTVVITTVLPAAPTPPGYHNSEVASAVICAEVDSTLHIQCGVYLNVLQITPEPDGTVLVSTAMVIA